MIDWKTKNGTISKKNDKNCFKYAFIASLHHEENKNDSQRKNNLKRFADQIIWKK